VKWSFFAHTFSPDCCTIKTTKAKLPKSTHACDMFRSIIGTHDHNPPKTLLWHSAPSLDRRKHATSKHVSYNAHSRTYTHQASRIGTLLLRDNPFRANTFGYDPSPSLPVRRDGCKVNHGGLPFPRPPIDLDVSLGEHNDPCTREQNDGDDARLRSASSLSRTWPHFATFSLEDRTRMWEHRCVLEWSYMSAVSQAPIRRF
jgi:hypothetical protein